MEPAQGVGCAHSCDGSHHPLLSGDGPRPSCKAKLHAHESHFSARAECVWYDAQVVFGHTQRFTLGLATMTAPVRVG